MVNVQTLKGFRDFLPAEARKRNFVVNKLREVFESFGFEPLETPALEYDEILRGKYGEEGEKLMYRFEDNGGRKVAMRYDQTVPLARVVAQYQNELPRIFKRYQMQTVWRGENTQKGRYREFLQCDIDTVGSDDPLADAEIVFCTLQALKKLKVPGVQICINDRSIFEKLSLSKSEIITIDKMDKIGREGVLEELKKLGRENPEQLLNQLNSSVPTSRLQEVIDILKKQGVSENEIKFVPELARGLDYYTSTIIEVKSSAYPGLSIAGGGRYDNLVGIFSKDPKPAVGIAFGFDRLMELLDENNLIKLPPLVEILVTIATPQSSDNSLDQAMKLFGEGRKVALYSTRKDSLEKQIKYARTIGIPKIAVEKDGAWEIRDV